jgi:hypothetical protein
MIVSLLLLNGMQASIVMRSGFEYAKQHYGYTVNHESVPLGDIIFDQRLTLQDVFLPAKLSRTGFVTLPGGSGFGVNSSEQYLAALAPAELLWNAAVQEQRIFFESGYYYMPAVKKRWQPELFYIGFLLPFLKKRQTLLLESIHNKITVDGTSYPVVGENTVKQFLSDAGIDFLDFFQRYVLEPKGLSYIPVQENIGFADLQLVGLADWGGIKKGIETLQIAMMIGIPLTKRQSYDVIWPNQLTRGAVTVQVQSLLQVTTKRWFYNPYLQGRASIYLPFFEKRRLREKRSDLPAGSLPKRFILNIVKPFEEYDAAVNAFADNIFDVSVEEGIGVSFLMGDFLYLDHGRLRIGILYEYTYKTPTKCRYLAREKILHDSMAAGHIMCYAAYAPSNVVQFSIQLTEQIHGKLTGRESAFSFNIVYKI